MELRRYKDILALKTADSRYVGFHASNLDLAELTPSLWAQMQPIDTLADAPPTSPVNDELETWNREINPDTQDADEPRGFRSFSINIAQVCNLKCTYCGAGGDGTYGSPRAKVNFNMVSRQLQWLLTQVPAGESFDIRFLGGEPLLYPSALREIASYARLLVAGRDVQLNFLITTNGTLMTPQVADLLADLKAYVTISLDGPPEVNDRLRPMKNGRSSTAMTLAGLEELRRVRERLGSLSVNAVFGDHNQDCVATYRFLQSLDLHWDQISLNYSISEEDDVHSQLYIEQMREVARLAFARDGLAGLVQIAQFRAPLAHVEAKTRLRSHCGAGKYLLQTDTRGELYTCNWFMSDPKEAVGSGVELNGERLARYQRDLIEANGCGTCWARYLCGGGCMAGNKTKNGDLNAKDRAFCLRERALAAEALQYYFWALNEQGDNHEKH